MPKMDIYEIRIQGHLDSRRSRHLEGMTPTRLDGGVTLLVGPLSDQAALYGLLSRLRDLGLPLLSVERLEQSKDQE